METEEADGSCVECECHKEILNLKLKLSFLKNDVEWIIVKKLKACLQVTGMQDCKAQPLFGKFCYSSTNFMLLGMALAQATGVPWIACVLRFLYVLGSQACLLSCSHLTQVQADNCTAFNQTAFLPDYLQGKIRFANSGSPKDLNRRVRWARVRMGRTDAMSRLPLL